MTLPFCRMVYIYIPSVAMVNKNISLSQLGCSDLQYGWSPVLCTGDRNTIKVLILELFSPETIQATQSKMLSMVTDSDNIDQPQIRMPQHKLIELRRYSFT